MQWTRYFRQARFPEHRSSERARSSTSWKTTSEAYTAEPSDIWTLQEIMDTCIAIRLVYKKNGRICITIRRGNRRRQRAGKRIQRMRQQGEGRGDSHRHGKGGSSEMILLIDNYDSFSYNLYQLIGSVETDIKVIRNDEYTIEEIEAMEPEALILSPGPGKTGGRRRLYRCDKVFCRKAADTGRVSGTSGDMRGIRRNGLLCKGADARQAEQGVSGRHRFSLFRGLGPEFKAARYHSLAAARGGSPGRALKVTAESDDGEIMALEHREYPVFGVQFHPESVMTPDGRKMIENFMEVVRND